jgi:tetratricopeptide (TPR) repeat protein
MDPTPPLPARELGDLEAAREWQAYADALEKVADQEKDAARKAALYLRLGRVLNDKLLQGGRALKHFQTAWKLEPTNIEPLLHARDVYWELGKLKMVETVLRRTLDGVTAPAVRAELLVEIGDVSCDQGNFDGAREHYTAAAALDAPLAEEARHCFADLHVDEASYEERVDELVGEAADAADPAARVRLLLRAARVAKRFGAESYEELLLSAYQADSRHKQAAALYEDLLAGAKRHADIRATQRALIEAAGVGGPALAHRYGARWASCHGDVEHAASLLEEALLGDPRDDGAFAFLRELWGTHGGDWQRVVKLCERVAEVGEPPPWIMVEAGRSCWLKLGDMLRARRWFERLAAAAPGHAEVGAFEKQIGEKLGGAGAPKKAPKPSNGGARGASGKPGAPAGEEVLDLDSTANLEEVEEVADSVPPPGGGGDTAGTPRTPGPARLPPPAPPKRPSMSSSPGISMGPASDTARASGQAAASPAPPPSRPSTPGVATPSPAPALSRPALSTPALSTPALSTPAQPAPTPSPGPAAASRPSPPSGDGDGTTGAAAPAAAAPAEPAAPRVQDDAAIAQLVAQADKLLAARRSPEYVRTIVQIAEAYVEPDKRVEYFGRAAEVYEKLSNATEAAKCYEGILASDPSHAKAREELGKYYEKRREYDKLIELMRRDAEGARDPAARLERYVEMARLASERIKRPQLCVELWTLVRREEPGNFEALDQLELFHERAREFEPLAEVLEQRIEITADTAERLKRLEKLAQIYGDRLKNEERSADCWKMVLELSPADRRAQENLKKKLLALKRWDDLEILYEESAKWDEFIRLLETQEAREPDVPARVGMLLKIAELWENKKQKADRAARAYEKILSLDATHLGAAEALIPIYAEAGNHKGLAGVIEVKLGHVSEPEARLGLLRELVGLYEAKLRKPDSAFERCLDALAIAGADEACATDAERLAKAVGGWERLAQSYRDALARAARPEAEGMLRLRLGRVLLDELGQIDEALEQYRAVYELEPDNGDALEALERLYRQTGRYDELLEVYDKQRDLAASADEQCRVLYGVAEVYEKELKNAESAIKTYWQVLDIEPTDARALEALDRLFLAGQRWQDYADVLRKRLDLDATEALIIDLKLRLGQTLDKHLGDATGALEQYREILYVDPQNDAGREALEGLLGRPEHATEVARILSEVYEARSDWKKLVPALEILVGAEEGTRQRVGLLRKIALVAAEHLGELATAFDAQARALVAAPDARDVREELEDLAERAKAMPRLAAVYAEVAEGLTDEGLARGYWMRHAAIRQELGDVDAAAASYARVLDIDPADEGALDAMETLFRSNERWNDLIGVMRRRIELVVAPSAREALFAQMAEVYDARLGRPADAIAAYQEVLAFDATSVTALKALEGLYTREGQHAELAENLEAQLRLADSEAAEIRIMLELAELQQGKLGLVPAAIETYRQVLERQPGNAPAIAALEQIGKRAEHEVEIAEVLGPLYRQAGDYQKLCGVYEVQIRRSDDAARAVQLLHELAQLHEDAAGNLDAAFDTLGRALALDPTVEATQDGLERLAAAIDRFGDLARLHEELAARFVGGEEAGDARADTDLAVGLLSTAARIQEVELGGLDHAVALHRRILELDRSRLEAVEALERIFRSTERWAELSQALQDKSRLLHDVERQKGALSQAAQIEEELLERADAAVQVYRNVLDLDAEDLRALDALVRLFVGGEKWAELLEIYGRKVELVDHDEKKRIYYQMGAVYERELRDVHKAIDVYLRVLELDPDDVEALGRLDVLYQEAGDWPELLTTLQREAELAASPAESVSYQYRIAELYDKRLDDVERAIELYRELLAQQPDHAPTLGALEALAQGDRNPVGAAQVLEPVYESMGDPARLIAALEVQVRHAADAYHRVELLQRIARLEEDNVGDHAAAFETYARAVDVDPTNDETLGQYERLAAMLDRWRDLATLYEQLLGRLEVAGTEAAPEDVARFSDVGLRLARIYEEQLEDYDRAIGCFRRVLAADGENAAAVGALDRLYEMTERWAELAEILDREAALGRGPEESLAFRFRLGQVRHWRLGDIDGAIACYGEVLRESPEHAGAREALEGAFAQGTKPLEIAAILEPFYESLGEFERLGAVLEATLAHKHEPAERIAHYYRMAELHEEKLVNAAAALGVLVRALQEFPADERALDDVERLAAVVDEGWEHLANAYADVLGAHTAPEIQSAIGKKLARLFEEELSDVQKAEETYRYVLGVVPLDVDCLDNLDRIYTGLEQYAELAQVLEQRAQTVPGEPYRLIEIYGRLGEIYWQRLGQAEDAVRIYRRVFDELDPTHEQANVVLEQIYGEQQQWTALYGLYEKQLAHAPGESHQADILAKMARLSGEPLANPAAAIETWRRVLELRGEDGEALGGLSELYERTQQWGELTEILERHMAFATDERETVAVLLRRARLYSRELGRDDSALDDYNRVLEIDWANVEALYAITDIWRRRGERQETLYALGQTVERAAPALPAEALVALYRELAGLYQQVEEQRYEAVESWRKLLEVDPRDFDAMAQLETLLRAEDRWAEVVDVKMLRARAFADPPEQIREYLEVAHVWEHQVGNPDGATAALEAVLELDAGHDDAFATLEKLHTAAARWEPLIELYLKRIESREEVKERTKLLRKVARVFDEHLHDQEQAYDALQTAFELDFEDEETCGYLEKMAAATKRWAGLVALVNGWLEAAKDPATQVALCLRLAKWYGEDLDRPDYAQPYYGRVLQLDPNNVAVLRQMASFYKKNAQWQQQGQLLEKALAVAVRETDRAAILTDMGEVLERHMGKPDQGMVYYQRAVDADPHYLPVLDDLERIYEAGRNLAELVDVLLRKAKAFAASDAARAAEVKLRAGGIVETQLGQLERAIEIYREVLELDAGNVLAMRGLERAYHATERWPELLEVLEMHLDVALTERERTEVLLHIAQLQEDQFLKPDLAAQRLEQVIDLDPTSEAAYTMLARAYQKLRQWLDLIGCLERHIGAIDDRYRKVDLYRQMAEVYAEHVQDHERALDAYLNIVDIDPDNVVALEALAKLYERQDDAARAIEYMTRVAELTADGTQRVEAFYRIGRQLEDKLGDRSLARERFEQALDLHPHHLPTLGALRAIAVDEADWDLATRYLDTEQQITESPRARAKLLVELGRLRAEMLDQRELAVEAYETAHQCDPDNEEAALPLAREYAARADWPRAEPLSEMLVRKAPKKERAEQIDLYLMHGKITAALGKHEDALRAFQAAHKLDLTNQEAIRGLAEANFHLRDWAGALTNYQKVLTTLGDEQVEERAGIYFRLGCVKREQGQVKQAIANFEKGLQLEPAHRATLEALVGVYEALNDWSQACAYRQQILDSVLDGEERYQLLQDLGNLWAEKVGDPQQALSAFEQAADLKPDDHLLLHRMLQLYQKVEAWERVVETIQRIAESDPKPERRARYLFTMGQAYRDKLDNPYQAAELFDEALDLDPSYLDAFKRIDKIYTQVRDWAKLERAYRKMIFRIAGKGKPDLEYNLWHALGLIYRDRLGDAAKANDAFNAALAIKPDATQERLILAEIAEQTGRAEDAIAHYRALVKRDAMNVDAYRAIYNIQLQAQSYDGAWCAAGVLAFLRRANEEEQRFFDDWRPKEIPRVTGRLDNDSWVKLLVHEDEDLYIGKVFESVALAALKAKIEALRAKKEMPALPDHLRQDPQQSTLSFARAFWWAADRLGIRAPVLYARTDVGGGLVAVPNEPPASVAGQGVLSGLGPLEQVFAAGQHLAMYRGEHYLKTLFQTQSELTVLLYASIALVTPQAPVPPEIVAQVQATAQGVAKFMQPLQLEQLKSAVKKFVEQGARANIKRWGQSVETTASRAGLLLAGDLEVAKKIIGSQPQLPGDLTPQERIKDLMLFAVSEPHFRLRKIVGLQIQPDAAG